MKRYTEEKIRAIKKAIDEALENGARPFAAFDADGTLWDTDIGENFFHFQIKNNLLTDLPKDPLGFYQNFYKKNAKDAFLWLVQINKNHDLLELKKWAKSAFENYKNFPFFDDVIEILRHLQKQKVNIYVVTASMKWAAEPALEQLGIPLNNIIGVSTKIKNGIITDVPDGIMTWQEGKATRLLNEITPHQPFFCAGNTMGDLALLEAATHIRLANCALPPNHDIYESEQNLIEIARSRNWFYHTY